MSQPQSQSMPLSTYPTQELLQRWRNEQLTETQAIGHLLQHVATLEAQILALQKQVVRSQQAISPLLKT